jgi:pyrroloquinoline quinone (PQQ) biosynthesis protein C
VLQERLLQILDRKDHWAWPWFAQARVPLPRLLPHFQQEWEVYVRDFPILLARVLGHGPPAKVCAALATNIYEEQTGGISGSAAHPELFLRMMEGCGFSRADFAQVTPRPAARAYRAFLDRASWGSPWVIGAAVTTIFVEGSVKERQELSETFQAESDKDLEAAVRKHPLVRLHGVEPRFLELQRVHKKIEGGHRHDAWDGVLGSTLPAQEDAVVAAMEETLRLWLAYRDEVAAACGITR